MVVLDDFKLRWSNNRSEISEIRCSGHPLHHYEHDVTGFIGFDFAFRGQSHNNIAFFESERFGGFY